jgi:hypothetical protein
VSNLAHSRHTTLSIVGNANKIYEQVILSFTKRDSARHPRIKICNYRYSFDCRVAVSLLATHILPVIFSQFSLLETCIAQKYSHTLIGQLPATISRCCHVVITVERLFGGWEFYKLNVSEVSNIHKIRITGFSLGCCVAKKVIRQREWRPTHGQVIKTPACTTDNHYTNTYGDRCILIAL